MPSLSSRQEKKPPSWLLKEIPLNYYHFADKLNKTYYYSSIPARDAKMMGPLRALE